MHQEQKSKWELREEITGLLSWWLVILIASPKVLDSVLTLDKWMCDKQNKVFYLNVYHDI